MKLTREEQLLQTIIKKAWSDNDFKNYLISQPLEAIQSITGEKLNLPADKKILVTDQSSGEMIYINIPAQPAIDDIELNEEQLEIVAGGGDPIEPGIIPPSAQLSVLYN